MLKRINELERIKECLFNREQKELLQFYPKPSLKAKLISSTSAEAKKTPLKAKFIFSREQLCFAKLYNAIRK